MNSLSVKFACFQAPHDLHKVALWSDSDVTSYGVIGFEVLNRDGEDHQGIQPLAARSVPRLRRIAG